MWIEQSHIWPFRLNITFGWLQKLNPGYEICFISYQVNLCSEVSAKFNSLMPSLNIRSLPFVVFLGGFPSRCQNLSSGAIRPGGLLLLFQLIGHTKRCLQNNIANFLWLSFCDMTVSSKSNVPSLWPWHLTYESQFIISRGAGGPGREILQHPRLSVCLSVCLSVRLFVCPSRLVFAL